MAERESSVEKEGVSSVVKDESEQGAALSHLSWCRVAKSENSCVHKALPPCRSIIPLAGVDIPDISGDASSVACAGCVSTGRCSASTTGFCNSTAREVAVAATFSLLASCLESLEFFLV
jgi:hypothetical protein